MHLMGDVVVIRAVAEKKPAALEHLTPTDCPEMDWRGFSDSVKLILLALRMPQIRPKHVNCGVWGEVACSVCQHRLLVRRSASVCFSAWLSAPLNPVRRRYFGMSRFAG